MGHNLLLLLMFNICSIRCDPGHVLLPTLTLSVGNGNFDSTHTEDLATDGNHDTYALANPYSSGGAVTITCKFQKKYRVKSVKTWVTTDMRSVRGKLFDGTQDKRTLSSLDGNNNQPRTENMDDDGDRIIFERQGEIQLREVEVRIKDNRNFRDCSTITIAEILHATTTSIGPVTSGTEITFRCLFGGSIRTTTCFDGDIGPVICPQVSVDSCALPTSIEHGSTTATGYKIASGQTIELTCDATAGETKDITCNIGTWTPELICPVIYIWNDWGAWSVCSDDCGGTKERSRTCTDPSNERCDGDATESQACNLHACKKVDGSWSDWEDWSGCRDDCGGTRERTRTCTAPSNGGAQCVGDATESEACDVHACKACTIPEAPVENRVLDPSSGGKHSSAAIKISCFGKPAIYSYCRDGVWDPELVCPGWSDYGEWSGCSATCGTGTRARIRICTNPAPVHIGLDCPEAGNTESEDCNQQDCPVDGGWSVWGAWSTCSADCGGGSRSRTRTCTNPVTSHGGAECVGENTESEDCNQQDCPARERLAGEIVPVRAEQSRTKDDNEQQNGAVRAIDLDKTTWSKNQADNGASWFELTLDKVHCVEQVVWSRYNLDPYEEEIHATWTCSQTDCSVCNGGKCSGYSLTVYSGEAALDNLPSITDCKYGDKVKVESNNGAFSITEIAVTEKQGECAPGTAKTTPETACEACPLNTLSLGGHGPCVPCPEGQYTQTTGQSTACMLCAAGTYKTIAMSTCATCPNNSSSKEGAVTCDCELGIALMRVGVCVGE
ncbi:uncharacterized protein LOC134816658 [Bolinopsis microptera]|uniref:uncharacterized protein LOC134816658 n=1 Tax=Bolinopsis microptera TaxID=2820187 RepID=UPI003078A7CA